MNACVVCERETLEAEIKRLQKLVNLRAVAEAWGKPEIEELKAQRVRLLVVLNKGMTLIDHLMGELTHQTGRKPPFAVVLAKREFDAAMEALLAAPAPQDSSADLSPDASAGDPA